MTEWLTLISRRPLTYLPTSLAKTLSTFPAVNTSNVASASSHEASYHGRVDLESTDVASHEPPHISDQSSEFRDIILAASESVDKPMMKKRKGVRVPPVGRAARAGKMSRTSGPMDFDITKDPFMDHEKTPTLPRFSAGESARRPKDNLASGRETLSHMTLEKLKAFRFISSAVPNNDSKAMARIVSDAATLDGEDTDGAETTSSPEGLQNIESDFDLDEDVFEEVLAGDQVDKSFRVHDARGPRMINFETPPSSLKSAHSTRRSAPEKRLTAQQLLKPQTPLSGPSASIPPFLRANLPSAVPSDSLIPALTSTGRIPTLFRVAEVHRLLSSLPRDFIAQRVELYATVINSHRDHSFKKQHFLFGDLFFPQRPPYLRGTCIDWHESPLFETDTAPFLIQSDQQRRCRAIVQIDRNGVSVRRCRNSYASPANSVKTTSAMCKENDALQVAVLSIWEAKSEDVEYTRGIVGA